MGQPRIKWRGVKRWCRRNGYEIRDSGGDKIIVAPNDGNPNRKRQTARIGHTSCRNDNCELLKCYESQLIRVFGVKREDLM